MQGAGHRLGCPGFLLKGQVEGVPPAHLRFLDRRGDLLHLMSQGSLVPVTLPGAPSLQTAPFSPTSRLSLGAGRPPPHHAPCLPFCGLLGTTPTRLVIPHLAGLEGDNGLLSPSDPIHTPHGGKNGPSRSHM